METETRSRFPEPRERPERRPGAFEAEEIVERLLAAPFVDAGQVPLYHRASVDSGEMRLALAILDDALRCVVRHTRSPLARQRAEAREAQEWIDSDESSYALSFVPICQVFDVDPEWLRALVRRRLRDARRPPAWTSLTAAPGESDARDPVREVA